MFLEILYQDTRLIAVNKPAGMLVHRTNIDAQATEFCVQVLRKQIGQRVYPCHRLDKPTSGILLFALDPEALSAVGRAFSEKTIRKGYSAIVRGWTANSGLIEKPLAYQADGGITRGGGAAQPAVTEYRLCQRYQLAEPTGRFSTSRYSRVDLFPKTGRQHQLRRHLKHISHPVIGDTRYGDGRHNRLFRERFNSHRLLLHATDLEMDHPFTGEPLHIHSALPEAFDIPLPIVDS